MIAIEILFLTYSCAPFLTIISEEIDKNPNPVKKNHTVPVIVGVVAIIFWMCTQVTAVKQETILRSTGLLKFQPDKYQGAKRNKRYFEGWYYKFVSDTDSDDKVMSMAVVPGIFYGNTSDSSESHAFIFVTSKWRTSTLLQIRY